MKNTSLRVEDIFGDVEGKENLPPEQTSEWKNFSAKMIYLFFSKS